MEQNLTHLDINHLDLCRYIADLERQVSEAGITLELRTDFGYFMRLTETLPDKPYPTAMFNPLHHQIGPENGFWLKGTDKGGKVVHVQAMRHDDFTGSNLARECENLTAFYLDPEISAEKAERCRSFAPVAKKITGPACFHGEVWLRGGEDGFRGKGLSRVLPRLAMAIALLRWKPQFIYGFVYETLISNGVMAQYGYTHFQPGVVQWHRPSREAPLDVWVVWMPLEDLIEMASGAHERDIDTITQIAQTDEGGGTIVQAAAE